MGIGETKSYTGGATGPTGPKNEKYDYTPLKEGDTGNPVPLVVKNGNRQNAQFRGPAVKQPPRPRSQESRAADVDISSIRRDIALKFRDSQQEIRKMNLQQKAVYLAQAKEQIQKEYDAAITAAGQALQAELASAGGKIAGGIVSMGFQGFGAFKLGRSSKHAKQAEAATEKAAKVKTDLAKLQKVNAKDIKDLKAQIKVEKDASRLDNLQKRLKAAVKDAKADVTTFGRREAAANKMAKESGHKTGHYEAMSKIYSQLGGAASGIIQGVGELVSARFNNEAAIQRAKGQLTHETKELLDGLMQQNDTFGEQAKKLTDEIDSSQQQQAASTAQVLSGIAHNI